MEVGTQQTQGATPREIGGVSLREYQYAALAGVRDAFAAGKRTPLLMSPTGCHAPGTQILMFDGSTKAVECIEVGDLVMGPDSAPRTVTALHHGFDDMFQIDPVKGETWIVNGGHILAVKVSGKDEYEELTVRDWLSRSDSYRHLRKLYRAGVEFTEKDLPIDPYLLGVLLGDGCLVKSVEIANPDQEIHAEVARLAVGHDCAARVVTSETRCPVIRVTGNVVGTNAITNHLRDLGLMGHKAGGKFIPQIYKTGSRQQRLELLAGLIDTDGHLCGTFDYISKSRALANDIAFLARSLGLACYVTLCKKGYEGFTGLYYRCCISGHLDIVPCRVLRKKAGPRQQKKDVLVTGFDVHPLGKGQYFGFECDGDHLYLLADFTVTHNSGKTRMGSALVRGARQKSKKVYWICDRLELIDQASATFDEHGIEHGVIQGNHPRWRPYEPVQVISIQTAARRKLPPPDLCIIDEAHVLHQAHIRLMAEWPETKFLGLSATPFTEGLARHFDALVKGPEVKSLIEMGFLVPFHVWAPHEPDLNGVKVVAGEWDSAALSAAVDKPKVIGDIVETWITRGEDRQTIAFAVDVAHSKHIVEQFKLIGVDARHIDGYMPLEERSPIIKAFRQGEFRILVNCGIVDKGFDCPEASCLIQARPIRKSLALHIQQIGRVLRPAPGKADALIFDHAGNHLRHGLATDPLPAALDDGKRKKKAAAKEKEALPKKCNQCGYVKAPKVHECPKCGHAPVRQNAEFCEAGELSEFRTGEHRQQITRELLGIAQERGYATGWVAHQFRDLMGDWPRFGYEKLGAAEPSDWIRDWVRKNQRAKAIRRSYAERRV